MKFRIFNGIGLIIVFTILSELFSCTQTLTLPTKKAADLPAESEQEKQIIDKAKKHYVNMEFDSANTLFKKVLELNPYNIRSIYYLSKLNIGLKKYNESFNYCQQGLDFDGEYYQHFASTLGECYIGMNRIRSAISILSEAALKFPNNDRILYNLGIAYSINRDYISAEVPLVRSIALNPFFSLSHLELSKCYSWIGEYSLEIMSLMTFLSLEPNTELSIEALKLLDEAYLHYKVRGNKIIINPNLINQDSPFLSIELFMKMNDLFLQIDTLKRSYAGKVLEKTKMLLNIIDIQYTKYSEKFQNELLFRIYFKYLRDINNEGFAEVFNYYIYSKKDDPEINLWIKSNTDKIEKFRKWINEYQW
jgi:hypothetical protein